MVKDERSLRTRQRPVRSGALRGATKRDFRFRLPRGAAHRAAAAGSTACSHNEDKNHDESRHAPRSGARSQMPIASTPSRTAPRPGRRRRARTPCRRRATTA